MVIVTAKELCSRFFPRHIFTINAASTAAAATIAAAATNTTTITIPITTLTIKRRALKSFLTCLYITVKFHL